VSPGSLLPKPCAPALGAGSAPSTNSIPFHPFSVFLTTWGICSSLDSQPKSPRWMEFLHSFGAVGKQARYPVPAEILRRSYWSPQEIYVTVDGRMSQQRKCAMAGIVGNIEGNFRQADTEQDQHGKTSTTKRTAADSNRGWRIIAYRRGHSRQSAENTPGMFPSSSVLVPGLFRGSRLPRPQSMGQPRTNGRSIVRLHL
jgi:hypothetical protein